ncbi:MAG: hypothetical protein WC992_07655 [Acholeplasmataceae bacterium]|jgi:hypothetical protein|nr:hypothetical protein [Acholeplasmataceae bacterium]
MLRTLERKYQILVLSVIVILVAILGSLTYAWIVLVNRTDSFIATAAKVDVNYDIDFDGTEVEPEFFTVISGYTMIKSGVIRINVTDQDADHFLTNLRIDILVDSTVDTYIRVSIVDALTLATIDFEGNRGEVSIVDQPIPYAFNRTWLVNDVFYEDLYDAEVALGGITSSDTVIREDAWFDNRLEDGYYYYPHLIERNTLSTTLTIPFIEEYDGFQFNPKSFGYSLQFAILVEGIQAGNDAPMNNWGYDTPPWGGSWV